MSDQKTDATKERDAILLRLKEARAAAVKHKDGKKVAAVLDQMTDWVEEREEADDHTIGVFKQMTNWIEDHIIVPLKKA